MSKAYVDHFLKTKHTDGDGIVQIDDSLLTLRLTADIIREDSATDYDCMVQQLCESDEIKSLCESMVNQRLDDSLKCLIDVETLAEQNLIENIDRLLRAE